MRGFLTRWWFPIVIFCLIGSIGIYVWQSRRELRKSIPATVDPNFLQPLIDEVGSQNVEYPSLQVSADVQDPFISSAPCFVYLNSTCQQVIRIENDTVSVVGTRTENISPSSWSYTLGKQYVPIFPLFSSYLDSSSDEYAAYRSYRNFVSNINAKTTPMNINPVFYFSYLNYVMSVYPEDPSFSREVASKSILLLFYIKNQTQLLENTNFPEENAYSENGKIFIAATQAVFGEAVTQAVFEKGGALEEYYLSNFSFPTVFQPAPTIMYDGTIESPSDVQSMTGDNQSLFTFCKEGGAYICEYSSSTRCSAAVWLDSLCEVNIYQSEASPLE